MSRFRINLGAILGACILILWAMPIYPDGIPASALQMSMRHVCPWAFPVLAAAYFGAALARRLWIQTAAIALVALLVDVALTLSDGDRFYSTNGLLILVTVFCALMSTLDTVLRRLLPDSVSTGEAKSLIPIFALVLGGLVLAPVYVSLSSQSRDRNWIYLDTAQLLHLPKPVIARQPSGATPRSTPPGRARSAGNLTTLPPSVPVGRISSSAVLRAGGAQQALTIKQSNGYAVYSLEPALGQYLTIQMDSLVTSPSGGAVGYRVYSPANLLIASGLVSATSPSIHLPGPLSRGTYAVVMASGESTSVKLAAELQVDTPLTTNGPALAVSTSAPAQSRRFEFSDFSVTAGEQLALTLTNVALSPGTPHNYVYLRVSAPNGSMIADTAYDVTKAGEAFNVPLQNLSQTGTYSVTVNSPPQQAMRFNLMLSQAVTGTSTAGSSPGTSLATTGQSVVQTVTAKGVDVGAAPMIGVGHLPLGQFPPYPPAGAIFTLEGAGAPAVAWVTHKGSADELALVLWKPTTGDVTLTPLPAALKSDLEDDVVPHVSAYNSPNLIPVADSGQGVLFYPDTAGQNSRDAAFLTQDGRLLTLRLVTPDKPRLLVLPDQSILLYGGEGWVTGRPEYESGAIQRVWETADKINVEAIPALPEAGLRDYTLVSLHDGHLMALGGRTQDKSGCGTCVATTYLLAPGGTQWKQGPMLPEPRADLSATVLPDGSMLVAGGQVSVIDPNQTPATRQVLRWTPQSDRFIPVAPMPVGTTMPRSQFLTGPDGPDVVVSGGRDIPAIELYDVTHDYWVLLDSSALGHPYVFPYEGQLHAWMRSMNPPYSSPPIGSAARRSWALVPLRLAWPDTAQPVKTGITDEVVLSRDDISFASPTATGPALAAGGAIYGRPVGAVDALWPDGRIAALPALNFARRRAYVLTLHDSSHLVIGGTMRAGDLPSETGGAGSPDAAVGAKAADASDADAPPAEWLSSDPQRDGRGWVVLADPAMRSPLAVGETADGDALILTRDGAVRVVHAVSLSGSAGAPQILEHSLPVPASDCPGWDAELSGTVSIRGLADGRIIIAGGEIPKRIALWQGASDQPGRADRYVDTGESAPWSHYCIYDPRGQRWHESASVRASDAQSAILDDGRVLVAGPAFSTTSGEADGGAYGVSDQSPDHPPATEVSAPDGSSWSELVQEWTPTTPLFHPKLVELQGEAFLCGSYSARQERTVVLRWFDQRALTWRTLWQSAALGPRTASQSGSILLQGLPDGRHVMVSVCGR
ncbi:MAG: hypothetical protein ACREU2_16330 [Steroidobacteraceae bacterium]